MPNVDPENVRTIVQGAVTAIVGVVPAWLLYRQNKSSNDREAAERKELRDAETARAASESAKAVELARAQRIESERERYRRFWVIADKISAELFALPTGAAVPNPLVRPADRAELSAAYADVMFSADQGLRTTAESVRMRLDTIIVLISDGGGPVSTSEEALFGSLLDQFRDVAQSRLGE